MGKSATKSAVPPKKTAVQTKDIALSQDCATSENLFVRDIQMVAVPRFLFRGQQKKKKKTTMKSVHKLNSLLYGISEN